MPQQTFSPTDPRFVHSLEAAQQKPTAQPIGYADRLASLAEMIGQVNPTGGMATLGARLPIGLMREIVHYTGIRPSPMPRRITDRELSGAISPAAINQRVVPMLEQARVPQPRAYEPRIPEEAQLSALRQENQRMSELVARLASTPQPTAAPGGAPVRGGIGQVRRNSQLVRDFAPIDASAAKLTLEEIKAILESFPRNPASVRAVANRNVDRVRRGAKPGQEQP